MPNDSEPGVRKVRNARQSGSGKWSEYRQDGRASSRFDWASVDAAILLDAVVAITANGDAVVLGSTSDGSCGVVTVCSGPDGRYKFYFRDAEQAERELENIRKFARGE